MTRDEMQDFLRFLVRRRLLVAQALPSQLELCAKSDAILNAKPNIGAVFIMQGLIKQGFNMGPQDQAQPLINEWLESLQKTVRETRPDRTEVVVPPPFPPLPPLAQPLPVMPSPAQARPSGRQPNVGRQPTPQPDLPANIGTYPVIKQLGKGAMGEVYLCRDAKLDREVAIKRIQMKALIDRAKLEGTLASVQESVVMFVQEARIMAKIVHGNVVVIYDAGNDPSGPFIAMQYVKGRTLGKAAQGWTLQQKLRGVQGVATGLGKLHAAGVVHRDVKPDNVMVEDGTDRTIVMDLGLAVQSGQTVDDNVIAGTPAYMAPEQCSSDLVKVGPYSDVYALGVTLVYIIAGRMVHESTSVTGLFAAKLTEQGVPDMVKTVFDDVIPDEEERQRIVEIASRCLHKEAKHRYQHGDELAKALEDHFEWLKDRDRRQAEEQQRAAREKERELKLERERSKQKTILASLAAVVGVVALIAAGFFAWAKSAEQKAKVEAEARATEAQGRVEAETKARTEAQGRAEAETRARTIEERKVLAAQKLAEAQVLIRAADWRKAKLLLGDILAIDASYAPARAQLAQVLFNLRDPACEREWRWLMEHERGSALSEYGFYVMFHGSSLNPETRQSSYDDVIAKISDPSYRALAEAYMTMRQAELSRQAGRRDEWAEKLGQARERLKDVSSPSLAWMVAYMRGFMFLHESDGQSKEVGFPLLRQARRELETSIAQNADFPMTYVWLSNALYVMGDKAGAIGMSRRLLFLMPEWITPRNLMALYIVENAMTNPFSIAEKLAMLDEALAVIVPGMTMRGLPREVQKATLGTYKVHLARYRVLRLANRLDDAEQAKQEMVRLLESLEGRTDLATDVVTELQEARRLLPN